MRRTRRTRRLEPARARARWAALAAVWGLASASASCGGGATWSPPPGQPGQPAPLAAPKKPSPKAARALLDALTDEILEDNPALGREVGLRERFDGRIAPLDHASFERRIARLATMEAELEALGARPLDADEALDRGILRAHVRLALFQLRELRAFEKNPMLYGEPFGVNDYLDRSYAPLDERARRLVRHEKAALASLGEVKKNLRSPLSRPVVETSIKIFDGYASYLRGDVVAQTKAVTDEALRREVEVTSLALAREAEALAKHLREVELPKADESHVLGAAKYRAFLEAQEGWVGSLDDFRAQGVADLERNKLAMKAALAVKGAKPTRPKVSEYLGVASGIMRDARAFVVERKLVDIPSDEACVTRETPPYMRWNSAFLSGPGPFDAPGLAAYYYITLPSPSWPKREQEEYVMPRGTLVSTTVHEVWPGHFLQGLWAKRAPTRTQAVFSAYSFVEGWAHYVEEMMLEEGFGASDPQAKVGQLSDALLRNCRWVASVGVHADGKSLEWAAERFARDCFQDKQTAREQATRATFDPGYFAYTFGKRALLDLRAEVKRRKGAAFDLRAFHAAVLSHGAPPLPLLRERVLRDLTGAP